MLVLLTLAAVVWLAGREKEAWRKVREAKQHEAVDDPGKPGHDVATRHLEDMQAAAEELQASGESAEGLLRRLSLWAVTLFAAAWLARTVGAAFGAAAAAGGSAPGVAFWGTWVDGFDVLLWVAAVL